MKKCWSQLWLGLLLSLAMQAMTIMGVCADERGALQELITQIRQEGARFYAGTYPGYNDVAKVQVYTQALSAATLALRDGAADYAALYQKLTTAYADVHDHSFLPVTDGYYFFISAWPDFELLNGSRKAMLDSGEGSLLWNSFSEHNLKQVWKVTTMGEGTFSIQNVATGNYIAGTNGDGRVTMSSYHSVNQVFTHYANSQQWAIANVENATPYHTGGHGNGWSTNGDIVTWYTKTNEGSAWYIVPVSEQQLEYIRNGNAPQEYNDLVSTVYSSLGNHNFWGGTAIGFHGITETNAYYTALQAAQKGLASATALHTLLRTRLTSAASAAESSLILPQEGYYYFVNAWPAFELNQGGARKALTQLGTDALRWVTWNNESDARQLWKVSPRGDGTYSVQNAATKKYIGSTTELGGEVPMTASLTVGQLFNHLEGSNQFNIISTVCDIPYHPGGHSSSGENADGISGPIVTWWGGINNASAWYIMEVTDEALLQELVYGKTEAYRALETTVGNIELANLQFPVGTTPGYYDGEKVQTFEHVLASAKEGLKSKLSDERYRALNTALIDTYEAVKKGLIPITDGDYYIINAWSAFVEHQGVRKALSASYSHQLTWETFAQRTPQQVWHITSRGDGTYWVQNVGTGEYIGTSEGLGSLVPMTATQTMPQIFRHLDNSAQFNIVNPQNEIAYHPSGHQEGYGQSGNACTWWGDAYTASAWYVEPVTNVSQTFPIQCGINVSHWLSGIEYEGDERRKMVQEYEIRQLREWGFDFIRLPVGEDQLFHEDGTLDSETMGLIVNALTWCKKYRMRVVMDFHILRSHEYIYGYRPLFYSETDQQRLCDMWKTVVSRLKNYGSDFLAFEILNEPAADQDEQWNQVAAKVIKAIREIDTERILVVSSNRWALAERVPSIRVPDDDPNLMLTCHFYEPMLLSHYMASWRKDDYWDVIFPSGVHYPGKLYAEEEYNQLTAEQKKHADPYHGYYDKEWMYNYLSAAISYARGKGRTFLLGEFGCLPSVETSSRLNWLNDVVDICLENQMPRAYWDYKDAFGICNLDGSLKDEAVKDVLVRRETTGIGDLQGPTPIPSRKGTIYTLSGQRIGNSSILHGAGVGGETSQLPKGIYIVNGKKVLVR